MIYFQSIQAVYRTDFVGPREHCKCWCTCIYDQSYIIRKSMWYSYSWYYRGGGGRIGHAKLIHSLCIWLVPPPLTTCAKTRNIIAKSFVSNKLMLYIYIYIYIYTCGFPSVSDSKLWINLAGLNIAIVAYLNTESHFVDNMVIL